MLETIQIFNWNRATHDIYETLKRLATHGLVCKENIHTLAIKSGYCFSTVQRSLKKLELQHCIRVEHRFDRRHRPLANRYFLL